MYVWNISKVKERLAVEPPSFTRSLLYVVALALGVGVATALMRAFLVPSTLPERPRDAGIPWEVARNLVRVAVLISGIRYCYGRNGGVAGRHLVSRLVLLAWMCTVRVFVMFLLPLAVVARIAAAFGIAPGAESVFVWFSLEPVLTLMVLLLAGRHIGDVAARASVASG